MTQNGPGTAWETIGPYGGPPSDIHPSFDSGWSSGGAAALTEYALGVEPTSPGFATFTVHVHPNGKLGWAQGNVPTPHGLIRIRWARLHGHIFLHVTAPAGTTYTD
jgi:hypothetical protein